MSKKLALVSNNTKYCLETYICSKHVKIQMGMKNTNSGGKEAK